MFLTDKTQRGLGVASVLFLTLVTFSFSNAYAESEFEESLFSVFDWINEVIAPSIQDDSFDNSTRDNFQDTLDSGTDAGKKGVSLWFGIHEFFVDLIFASTTEAELGIDKDLIVIVSMFAVFVLMIGLVFHLIKENTKILMIVVVILLILGFIGITVEF